MNKDIKDYLPFYIGCTVITPDGTGVLVGLPWTIVGKEHVTVHFGKMVETKNSIDGGYNKVRNHGNYAMHQARYEPIGSTGITEDGFDMPGGIQLAIRPLSDMTEDEKQVIENMSKIYRGERALPSFEISKRWAADQTRYLLKRGFDLFGLIESGLAIDKTKLNKTNDLPRL